MDKVVEGAAQELEAGPVAQAGFDYRDLAPGVVDEVRAEVEAIRPILKRQAKDMLELGGRLTRLRDLVGWGPFGKLVKAEFNMSDRLARYYMQAFSVFGGNSAMIAELPSTVVIEIASAPKSVQGEALRRVQAGEPLKVRTVKELAKAARTPKSDDLPSVSGIIAELKPAQDAPAEPVKAPERPTTRTAYAIKRSGRVLWPTVTVCEDGSIHNLVEPALPKAEAVETMGPAPVEPTAPGEDDGLDVALTADVRALNEALAAERAEKQRLEARVGELEAELRGVEESHLRLEQAFKETEAENRRLKAQNEELRARPQDLGAKPAAALKPAATTPKPAEQEAEAKPEGSEPRNPRHYIDDERIYWVDIGNPAPGRRTIYFLRRRGREDEGVPRISKSLCVDDRDTALAEARRLKESGEIETFITAESKTKKRAAA